MTSQLFDLIIVGAGPAGSTAAIYAKRENLKVLLVDRHHFPRDKICGDALSGKSVRILNELNLLKEIENLPGAKINRLVFGSHQHHQTTICLNGVESKKPKAGFIIKRQILDTFLFEEAKKLGAQTLENFFVTDVITENGFIKGIQGQQKNKKMIQTFEAPLVIGADGFNSIIAKKTTFPSQSNKHVSIALRCYYKNVDHLSDQIELHFLKEVPSGYFWLFPLDKNEANIGIGMRSDLLLKFNINLRQTLHTIIHNKPFNHRFRHATPLEKVKGYSLPLGNTNRQQSGNGFLLIGDAAGLIDPFSGEGIGNAMYSAKLAIQMAKKALTINDVGYACLKHYETLLLEALGPELKTSAMLQQLSRVQSLVNFTIKKAQKHKEINELIARMIVDLPQQQLLNPLFYLKLLLT